MARTIKQLRDEATAPGVFDGKTWKVIDQYGLPHYVCEECLSNLLYLEAGFKLHSNRPAFEHVPCEICQTRTRGSWYYRLFVALILGTWIGYPALMCIKPLARMVGSMWDQIIYFLISQLALLVLWFIGTYAVGWWRR